MLQVGKGKSTLNQHRSNFITWAVAKAPLLLAVNLTELNVSFPSLIALMTNPELLALNQVLVVASTRKV